MSGLLLNQLLFLDWFTNFFFDIFNVVMILIFSLIGILIGIILRMYLFRPKNQILYCRERDGRGVEMSVIFEDAISLETNTDPELRFYKWGRSYEFRRRQRAFTRFFGKEGTAYTWRLEGFAGKEVVVESDLGPVVGWQPRSIELEAGSLFDMLKTKWDKLNDGKFWKQIPEAALKILQDNLLYVTVELEPGITPRGYTPITEDVIKKKADDDMAELMGEGLKGAIKKGVMDWVPWLIAGAGIMAIASKMFGWW